MAERRHGEAPASQAEGPRASSAWLAPRPAADAVHDAAPAAPLADMQRAASESGEALDPSLQARLQAGVGHDFSHVRVHGGAQSARAAERIGARAYTLGSDIHLGAEAHALSGGERSRLLAHEAVHTAQQGGGRVAPHAGLAVSNPGDAAEREAERIAQALHEPRSPSLALRDRLRSAPLAVARSVGPQVQRDLTGKYPVTQGEFNLGLKNSMRDIGGTKISGLLGTIRFKPNDKAQDSANIRLLQVVRVVSTVSGKDAVGDWTGGEANRTKVMTSEDKSRGIEGGFFVDHSAAAASPRTKSTDVAVSPYYRDYWPNAAMSQDGSKKGKAVRETSLADFPGSSARRAFSFETVAKAADTGHVYGTVMWGFTIADPAKGKIEKERAVGRDVTLATTDKAIEKFDQFYRNPGASTAP